MPFKSKAQRRKFAELLVNGKITDEQYEEWNRSTGKKELPERIHPKPGAKRKTTTKKKKKKTTARKKTTGRTTTARKKTVKR
jgi:hypothetical protein